VQHSYHRSYATVEAAKYFTGANLWKGRLIRDVLGSTIGSFADQPSALLPINRQLYHL
jgi:hypothetical protein